MQTKIEKCGREQHLENCRRIASEHFSNKRMFVVYLRKHSPKFHGVVNEEEAETIKDMLKKIPLMTEKSYLSILSETEELGNSITVDEALRNFRTIRSIVRSNSSPLTGVIVAFKEGEEIRIGWSLCNHKDKFNQYDGIRRAIERSMSLSDMMFQMSATTRVLNEKKGEKKATYTGPQNGTLPHSCVKQMARVIERAKAHLS